MTSEPTVHGDIAVVCSKLTLEMAACTLDGDKIETCADAFVWDEVLVDQTEREHAKDSLFEAMRAG